MQFNAAAAVTALIGIGLVVNRIHRVDSAFALLNPASPMIQHLIVFKVKESTALAGNKQHRLAGMTVDFDFHLPV